MKKRGLKRFISCLCTLLISLQILSAGFTINAANNNAQAYLTTQDPGFSYCSTGKDFVSGKDYYALKNNKIQIGITSNAAANNTSGTLTAGALCDMVDLSCNRENIDWGAMFLNTTMEYTWNNASKMAIDLPNLSISQDGKSITAEGAYRVNNSIKGKLVYSLVDDSVGVVRMDMTLTNTGTSDYKGYFEYLCDPDESGEQVNYTPGVGYTTQKNSYITTGWNKNYLFNGPKGKVTGNTAHTIIWPKDQQPASLVNEGYFMGVWFNADLPAGSSKTITFYHAVTVPKNASAPYQEAEILADLISNGADLDKYASLTGKVYDFETNTPVANAQVTAKYAVGEKQGQIACSATTDANGNYSMFIEKDVYTLTASMLNYKQQSASIDMTQVEPKLDIPVQKLTGVRVSKNISLSKWGSGVEAGLDDYVVENNKLAASVIDTGYDSQVTFTRGRILDMSTKTQNNDGLDWIYTSWISEKEPVTDDGNPNTNEGDQWNKLNTRFDTIEVTRNADDCAELTAKGVYAPDLSSNPNNKQAELTQVMDLKPNSDYITVTTTVKNTSGADLPLFIGDVLDYDIGGSQATYIPGVGQLSNDYAHPVVVAPSQPWVAQFGDGGVKQVYAMIYDNNNIKAFGSVNWVGAYTPVTIAADGSYTYTRKLFVADSSVYANYWDAVSAFVLGQQQGCDINVRYEDKVYAVGDYATFNVTVKNNSNNVLKDLKCSLDLPYQLVSTSGNDVNLGDIPAGETREYAIKARAIEAGRGKVNVNVAIGSGIPLTFGSLVSVSGEGWYASDSHSHSVYSDGSGTIKNNTDAAYSDGLSWLYSTDHNSIRQYQDTQIVTGSSRGDFVSIAGNELTSNIGHALAYNIPYASTSVYPVSGLKNIANAVSGQRTWQNVIDEVKKDGGLFFVAHPNYPGLKYPDIFDIRNFDGVEVWNGFYHALDNVNTVAFNYWDMLNSRGEKKYYGLANSDAHNPGKIGDPHLMIYLPDLSIANANEYLKEGKYFGTNGPQLRFDINGVNMGQALKIMQDGQIVRLNLRAFDQNFNLTGVKLYKNTVTGSAVLNREIVQSWDLTGQNIKEWSNTVELPVKNGEFYRIEVCSEKGTTGNGGSGTGSGTGYAFSNPIWIETGSQQNSDEATSMSYNAGKSGARLLTGQAGNYYITAYKNDRVAEDKLSVTASSGASVEKSYDAAKDIINVKITSADGTNIRNYPVYVVRSEDILQMLDKVTLAADKTALKSTDTALLSVIGIMNDETQADLSQAQIVYTSDNEQVATVDESGIVTATGEGTVNIKATVLLDGITADGIIQIVVDNTAPTTSLTIDKTGNSSWYNSDVIAELSATDNLSGVDRIEYRVGDAGDWITYAGPVVITREGVNTLQYRSVDKAGNIEDIKQQTVGIDKTIPDFNLIVDGNVLGEGSSFDDYLPLTFKVWDIMSGLASAEVTIDGKVYSIDPQTQSSIDIDLAGKAGSYTAAIVIVDNAGNRLEKTFKFTVTTSINSIRQLIDRFIKSEELKGSLVPQLTECLNQTQHKLDIERPDQAAKHMGDFIKHLNNEALQNDIGNNAKTVLITDAEALISTLVQ